MEEIAIDYVFRVLDIPWLYYLISLAVGVVVWRTWRWEGGLLAGYVFLILAGTLLVRQPFTGTHFQPSLLWSWREWATQRIQILTNVIIFIPIGILVGLFWTWRGLILAVDLSITVEVLQLITARGLCEFDGVIHNALGAAIGVGLVMVIRKRLKRWNL